MKKLITKPFLLGALLLGININSIAQDTKVPPPAASSSSSSDGSKIKFQFGPTLNTAFLTGDWNDGGHFGMGAFASGKVFFGDHLALAFDGGFTRRFLKNQSGITDQSYTIWPITAGLNYFFTSEGFRPYVGLNLGPYINHAKAKTAFGEFKETNTYFGLAPEVGFLHGLSDRMDLMFNVRYNIQFVPKDATLNPGTDKTHFNYFGVNLGLLFKICGS